MHSELQCCGSLIRLLAVPKWFGREVIAPVSVDCLCKREYSRMLPEIFGGLPLKFGEPGVRRRMHMREMPGFPPYSRLFREAKQDHVAAEAGIELADGEF